MVFKFGPKVTRNDVKIRSSHLGPGAVWRPHARRRRVLRTMYGFKEHMGSIKLVSEGSRMHPGMATTPILIYHHKCVVVDAFFRTKYDMKTTKSINVALQIQ